MADTDAGGCRLYLITPERIDLATFRDDFSAALDAGDVACVQLRLKNLPDDDICRAAEMLCAIAQSRDVAFLLNDRPDLARKTGCDGVHVGQDDWSYAKAREVVGAGGIVGVTCHDSRHLAIEAGEAGADYVAFGAFYPTTTKAAKGHPTPEILEWWSELTEIPCVAIGGITAENCAPLVQAGANFLAVVGAVWNHPEGPAAGVRAMNEAMENCERQ